MKKSILFLALLVSTVSVIHAQFQKGDKLFGGGLGVQFQKEYTSVTLAPSYGSFISDHFFLGGQLGFTGEWSNGESAYQFSVGPEARYYFNPQSQFIFFAGTFGNYNYYTQDSFNLSFFNAGVQAGANYFISNSFMLEGRLSTSKNFSATEDVFIDTDWSRVTFTLGFQVLL